MGNIITPIPSHFVHSEEGLILELNYEFAFLQDIDVLLFEMDQKQINNVLANITDIEKQISTFTQS